MMGDRLPPNGGMRRLRLVFPARPTTPVSLALGCDLAEVLGTLFGGLHATEFPQGHSGRLRDQIIRERKCGREKLCGTLSAPLGKIDAI